ncbi:hypothetical protein PEC301645_40780 [Pectobacterium carotovorum subsp. carotovorum]|nr:hypothetical protein PEC301645_40780 [Pectobacterium carotovorum subsp. carotovorum]
MKTVRRIDLRRTVVLHQKRSGEMLARENQVQAETGK